MLLDGFAHLVPIAVERHQSLRSFPVTEPFGDDGTYRPPLVGIGRRSSAARARRRSGGGWPATSPTTAVRRPSRTNSNKSLNIRVAAPEAGTNFTTRQRLLRTVVTGRRLLDPGSIQHPNTVAARSGPRHGKKGKTFAENSSTGFREPHRASGRAPPFAQNPLS